MFHRQVATWVLICIGIGVLGFLGSMLPFLSDAEESLGLQLLYLLRGPEKVRGNIAIVAIDGASAETMGLPSAPNKWPRRKHAQLIDKVLAIQPAVIAFDMIFYESQDAANDSAFASAIKRAGNVVLTQSIDRQTIPVSANHPGKTVQLNIERIVPTIPILADAAVGQAPFPLPTVPVQLNQFWCFRPGSANIPTLPVVTFHVFAKDAFADFVQLLFAVDETLVEILPHPEDGAYDVKTILSMIQPLHAIFESRSTLAEKTTEKLAQVPPAEMLPETRSIVDSFIGVYSRGNASYLNFYGPPGTIQTIPYHRILDRQQHSGSAKEVVLPDNCVLFVGQTASNWLKTHDRFYTVFSGDSGQDISGVEIAATAFANLLEKKAVHPLGVFPKTLTLLGWAVLTASIGFYFRTVLSITGLILITGLYLFVARMQFSSAGIWYPLVVPIMVQMPAAFIISLLSKYRTVRIERKNIREAFGHYLPDEVVDKVSANTKALRLGGQVFYGVCLFTDAENYTALSETMDPSELTRLMNRYYEAVFRPIQDNDGLVLQVVGDAVMALWSAPEPDQGLKRAACRAAIGITNAVEQFNRGAGAFAMPTRVGIHAGEMLLGNIGAGKHFEYRPVGDIVNTASRLEGLNKHLGTKMLVSDEAIGLGIGCIGAFGRVLRVQREVQPCSRSPAFRPNITVVKTRGRNLTPVRSGTESVSAAQLGRIRSHLRSRFSHSMKRMAHRCSIKSTAEKWYRRHPMRNGRAKSICKRNERRMKTLKRRSV
jgi:adenylate cyclase